MRTRTSPHALQPGCWLAQQVREGLGTVEWEGDATSAADALNQWSATTGRVLPPHPFDEAIDVNRDGSYWQWDSGFEDAEFVVERADR